MMRMTEKKNIHIIPEKSELFKTMQGVLEVYTQHTVFYPATIVGRFGNDVYLRFDNDKGNKAGMKKVDGRFAMVR